MMIKAILVDDEKHPLTTLSWKLEKFCPDVTIVEQFTDSSKALDYLRENQPDILFLDIEMPRLDGFELLEELGDFSFEVIFTTAYDEFGIRAVKVDALDYLLKPVQNKELKLAIEKYKNKHQETEKSEVLFSSKSLQKKDRIALATKESIQYVLPEDIILCSSDSNYTLIYLSDGRKKIISRTLKDVEKWLAPYGFFRAHLSHLVNLQHIKEYVRSDGGYLLLSNGKTLPVARNRKEALLGLL
jgi:two-component system LytT family response regulator